MSTKDQLIDLMRQSVVTQALITILALGVTFFLVAQSRDVPEEVWAIDGLVIGFYFGGKVQSQLYAEKARTNAEGRAAAQFWAQVGAVDRRRAISDRSGGSVEPVGGDLQGSGGQSG